jgi:hypothetical protein
VPHSKALRASNIFRAESRKMPRPLWPINVISVLVFIGRL